MQSGPVHVLVAKIYSTKFAYKNSQYHDNACARLEICRINVDATGCCLTFIYRIHDFLSFKYIFQHHRTIGCIKVWKFHLFTPKKRGTSIQTSSNMSINIVTMLASKKLNTPKTFFVTVVAVVRSMLNKQINRMRTSVENLWRLWIMWTTLFFTFVFVVKRRKTENGWTENEQNRCDSIFNLKRMWEKKYQKRKSNIALCTYG